MATIPTLTDSELLSINIRTIMRQLKSQLASGDIANTYDLNADIPDEKVERTKALLFGGVPAAPIDGRQDPSWITRFNLAIAQGNQEKAIKILVDKEDRISISWTKPASLIVKKYLIYYKNDYYTTEYNGTGLMYTPDSSSLISPFETTSTYYKESGTNITLELYGNDNVLREFAVQPIDLNNQPGTLTKLYKTMALYWEKPVMENIKQYRITYTINGQVGYGLFSKNTQTELAGTFYLNMSDLQDPNYPRLDLYSPFFNGDYAININAVDVNGNLQVVSSFKLDKQEKPCYNEYCELQNLDVANVLGDQDSIDALLWYFNYIFFLDNQNWWNASRMVAERKNRNTVFPKTVPWFFPPILKGNWERQESEDQFVTYLKQSLRIPITGRTGDSTIEAGTLDVFQNLIDDFVFIEISGSPGDLDVYISTPSLDEEYHGINNISDLAVAMSNSSIGRIAYSPEQVSYPLTWIPFRSYKRESLTITRQQENIFTFAYFGDEENTRNIRQYTSLDPSPRRRIRMEKWENDYLLWLNIHANIVETWIAILTLNPLGLVLDIDEILRQNIAPATLNVAPIEKSDSLPNEVVNKIINILKEDDALTTTFSNQMADIYAHLLLLDPKTRGQKREFGLTTETLQRKSNILNNRNTEDYLDIFRLPYGWDLQRVAMIKLKETLYWVDVADFNDIANPLNEVEVFEGRLMALPKTAVTE